VQARWTFNNQLSLLLSAFSLRLCGCLFINLITAIPKLPTEHESAVFTSAVARQLAISVRVHMCWPDDLLHTRSEHALERF
jgi:hypothetical protein